MSLPQNKSLSDTRRHALAKLVEKRLTAILDKATAKKYTLKDVAVQRLVRQFKADTIQRQIAALDEQSESLGKKLQNIGFEWHGYRKEYSVTGGKPLELFNAELDGLEEGITKLTAHAETLKQKIWLSSTSEEIQSVLTELAQLEKGA